MKHLSHLLIQLIFALFLSLSSIAAIAEDGPISSANQQLRSLFSSSQHPTEFLYDRAAHLIDSAYFNSICPLTTNCYTWYHAYEEMYNSSRFQIEYLHPSLVAERATNFEADTVTIGVLDWSFSYLKQGVLDCGDYFIFDTINTKLYDKASRPYSPYAISEIFMVAPLVESSHTRSPVFRVAPNLSFISGSYRLALHHGTYSFTIDFGDGTGSHIINIDSINYISAHYPAAGEYTMEARIIEPATGLIIKRSKSSVVIKDGPTVSIIDSLGYTYTRNHTFDKTELIVHEFTGACTEQQEQKIIFILAGYNPASFQKFHRRTPAELFQKYVVEGNMTNLPAYGYKFVIVDWEDPNDDIRFNAERFTTVINHHIQYAPNKEQFVIIGHSMGCLIARYALLYMEAGLTYCYDTIKKHNTRLFISNDGPHQGVNIPMSIQNLYGKALGKNGVLRWLSDYMDALTFSYVNFSTTLLNGKSVRQMLNRHYATATLCADNMYSYAPDSLFSAFFDEMADMGNYPKYCKLVALSNGSMEGMHQQNVYYVKETDETISGDAYYGYSNAMREANDHFFEAYNKLKFRILGLKFGTEINIDLRSNPNNTGLLYNLYAGVFYPKIKLKWFGIKITTEYDGVSDIEYGTDLRPYCTSAGGQEYLHRSPSSYSRAWEFGLGFDLLGFDIYCNPGTTFALYGRLGIPWLLDMSGELALHTDGLGFGFVPICSAFDYGPMDSPILDVDFRSMPASTIMQNTPFDVLIGRLNPAPETLLAYNGNHEDVLNPILWERETNEKVYSEICGEMGKMILNAEIGDENLFLTHNFYFTDVQYSASNRLSFNEAPPYYIIDNATLYQHPNLYSPFIGAISHFEYRSPLEFLNTICTSSDCFGCNYPTSSICCFAFDPPRRNVLPFTSNYNLDEWSESHIKYGKNKIYIYSVLGNLLYTHTIDEDSTFKISSTLPAGLYLIVTQDELGQRSTQKIIVK